MATGKSDVGKELAGLLKRGYADTDAMIEQKAGMKIRDIFALKGEKYFRDVETEVLAEACQLHTHIISTGGGIVLRRENIENMRRHGRIVNLHSTPEKIFERVSGRKDRPLLDVTDQLKEIKSLLADRQQFYNDCDLSVDTTFTTPHAAAGKIVKSLGL